MTLEFVDSCEEYHFLVRIYQEKLRTLSSEWHSWQVTTTVRGSGLTRIRRHSVLGLGLPWQESVKTLEDKKALIMLES